MDKIKAAGATGGVIVLDKEGNIAFPFNSLGMIRGHVNQAGVMKVGTLEAMR